MKNLICLTVICLSIINCSSQKKIVKSVIKEIVYKAHTRGSSETIIVNDYTVHFKTNNSSKTNTITKKEREVLDEIISSIALENIKNLKAPTNKRLYDGALHASIEITVDNKHYKSSSFDDDSPPNELKKLMNTLKELIK